MKTLSELLKKDSDIIVPEKLLERILFGIEIEKTKIARQQQMIWGGIFVASLGSFVASGIYTAKMFAASNFGSYFSLIFSDRSVISSIWKQLALSLVESIPLIEICVVLASVAIVLWSVRNFSKNSSFFITRSNTQIA